MRHDAVPRLMLVEDDPDTALLIRETLRDHFGDDCVKHCPNITDAMRVDVDQVDLVLSDMNLPDGSGLDVLERLLARRSDLPIVLVTGEGILDNALEAIRRGAYDYIVKAGDYLFAIPINVEKNLAIWRTKQDNQRLQRQLEKTLEEIRVKNRQLEDVVTQLQTMATTDPLTGLANRRAFNEALERSFSEKQRYGQDLACLMIDLDNFKQFNDALGHQAGDRLLLQTARVLQANCRRCDVAGRYGGDEFIVLLPMTDESTALQVAQRILQQFTLSRIPEVAADGKESPCMGMSIGLACFSHARPALPEQLVSQADHALYRAKQAGKGQLAVFDVGIELKRGDAEKAESAEKIMG